MSPRFDSLSLTPTKELRQIKRLYHDSESAVVVMVIAELLGLGPPLACVCTSVSVCTLTLCVHVNTLQVAQHLL